MDRADNHIKYTECTVHFKLKVVCDSFCSGFILFRPYVWNGKKEAHDDTASYTYVWTVWVTKNVHSHAYFSFEFAFALGANELPVIWYYKYLYLFAIALRITITRPEIRLLTIDCIPSDTLYIICIEPYRIWCSLVRIIRLIYTLNVISIYLLEKITSIW